MSPSLDRRTLLRTGLTAITGLAVSRTAPGAWASWSTTGAGAADAAVVRTLDGFRVDASTDGTDASVTVPRSAGSRFTMIGLRMPSGGEVSVRSSMDGERFDTWQTAEQLGSADEGPDGEEAADAGTRWRAMSHLVWTGPAHWVQLKVAGADPAAVQAVLLDEHTQGGDDDVIELASTGSASTAVSDDEPDVVPAGLGLRVVTRSEWGADERLRGSASYASEVRHGVVHHTATSNAYSAADAPAIVRSIYRYHTVTLGWRDVGYNLLIDRYGVVYEGRYGGIDRPVIGAHARGVNTGSFGVAVIGDFRTAPLPAAAREALLRVLAAKFTLHAIEPTAAITAANGQRVATLVGHRAVGSTTCPGDQVDDLLPSLRSGIGDRITTGLRDVAGDVHERSIHRVVEAGIAQGYPDGTFRPQRAVNRGQMATFLTRAAGLAPSEDVAFPDVGPDHTHRPAIGAAAAAGVALGYPDGRFRPAVEVTRGQMASFLLRATGLPEGPEPSFDDVRPSHPHAAAIGAITSAGIADGFGDGSFRPDAPVTRGQMATFLVRAFDL